MSKITIALLKTELNSWLALKKSSEINQEENIQNFGKYMNNKYSFNNKTLSNEKDHNTALLLIMKDHVQEIN